MSWTKEFLKGLVKENPVLVMLLGTCPTLAVTTMAQNGLGMGLATTFVLVGSSVVISLLKKVIPGQVRLPAYIVIIAGFVTLVSFLLQVYVPDLYGALGVFLSLITVNCIILGRAEAFASKNTVAASVADGLGMGFGFTLALVAIGSIREILGSGSWFGLDLTFGVLEPIRLFATPAGGFMVFGLMVALVNKLSGYQISKKKMGCDGCPSQSACGGSCEGEGCAEQ
ncbi:MAG: electron transport complex subunit E [Oscillospiraceae bacterium]|jgi:electron transport complex protein RnfE|nr:electron transport complex subunit E [Oscillospiraceae bacterium]